MQYESAQNGIITYTFLSKHENGKGSLLQKSECQKATKKNIENKCLFSSSLLQKSERRKEWKEHRKCHFCLIFTFELPMAYGFCELLALKNKSLKTL